MSHSQWQSQESGAISLTGELTREFVPGLWAFIKDWKPATDKVEISLCEASRIDSSGMALLIHLIEHAKKFNCHIMLTFVPDELLTLFQISNVDSMMAKHIGHTKN
ncbi:lipid asymmetry maintenance protein MlaB [Vibrio sp. JC009]|uniref:STAS domain-containing protein n=1 Tax=Vibrio sp. JC009 TaxID=2912314 RepID=UPI0023B00342|nr:lipid asymmetry maintenance protein MlaB [Vibrio sp. JC009]WED21513.1 lipid asymmetry maintenance protein MlaB [Vibrio sp. JC009]